MSDLLGRLEVSIVKLSEVRENDWSRIDAEYFSKQSISLINSIRKGSFTLIENEFNVSKLAGFEFTEYFTDKNMNSENSYIALTSKNIQCDCLDLSDYITIDKFVADQNLTRSKIKTLDVILSYTGEYRRALVMQEKEFFQLGPNICRIRPTGKRINPFFLSVFFNSKIGQIILDKEKTLSAQPTVAMSRIRKIPVPLLPLDFQEKIAALVKEAHAKLERSKSLYKEAEDLLLDELGLSHGFDFANAKSSAEKIENPLGFSNPCDNISIKKFSDFAQCGRLDAEYWQRKYEILRNVLINYQGGFSYLSDVAKTHRGSLISDTLYTDNNDNMPYIRGADISSNFLETDKMTYIHCSFRPTTEYRCKENDIVFALIGSVGTLARVTKKFNGAFISNNLGIIHIDDNRIKAEYLHLLLSHTKIGNLLFAQKEMRTAQPKISDKDILDFPIPILPAEIQEKIAALVQNSFSLKGESRVLLESAKQMVEREIECA